MSRSGIAAARALACAPHTIEKTDVRRRAEVEDPPRGRSAPEDPALRAVLGALMCAGPAAAFAGWRRAEGCAETTQRIGLDPMRVRLHAATAPDAWREVAAISPLALDVLAVVVDRFQSEGGEVRLVRCAEILEAKGSRRWGEERYALEEQVARELTRLGRITVGPEEERLFSVTGVGDRPTSFVVGLEPRAKARWAAAPARRLSPRLLQFDHRMNRGADVLAKKLGLYFSLAGSGGRPFVRSVRSALRAVGIAPQAGSGARCGRLADRFEEAALRLRETGLFAIAFRGESQSLMEEARCKGWVRRWLDAELLIEPLD